MGCLIGHTNRIDSATLTGGSYAATLPLSNLQTKIIGQVARTNNLSASSTTFNLDFGTEQKIEVMSLVNHNIYLDGTVRLRASLEGSASNLLQYTEGIEAWAVASATPIAVPNFHAGFTGVSVMNDNTSGDSPHKSSTVTGLNAGTYAFSIFIDLALSTSPTDLIHFTGLAFDSSYSYASSTFDPVTKALAQFSTYRSASHVGHYAEQIGGSTSTLWRLTKVVAFTENINTPRIDIFTATHLSRITVGFPQIEVGTRSTSYYPNLTNATSTTRPAGYMDSWQSYNYDSGLLPAIPAVYNTEDLDWEDSNFWAGVYSTEDLNNYTTNIIHILTAIILARYWRIDIIDTLNPAGYVQIGRVFMGSTWIPANDAEVGLTAGWETATQSQKALNGTKYYQRRTPYRVTRFTLNVMSPNESMSNAFEIDKKAGIDGEVLWVQDTNDTLMALQRRFLGTFRELNPIEYPYSNLTKKAYTIEETV